MQLRNWLQNWRCVIGTDRRRPLKRRKDVRELWPSAVLSSRQSRAVALLEQLEERIVLTTPVGNTLALAMPVTLVSGTPWSISASVGDETPTNYYALDVDLFRVDLTTGQSVYADVDAQETSSGIPLSGLDGYLRLFDAAGNELANNDDSLGADPFLSYTVSTPGTFYIGVSGAPNRTYDPLSAGGIGMGSSGDFSGP